MYVDVCRQPVRGGGRCRFHGASAPQVREARQRRLAAAKAWEDLARLGVQIETTPIEALEQMLYESAGNVAVLREMVGELGPDQLYGPVKHGEPKAEPHVLVVMYDAERDRLARIAKDCAGLGLDERKVRIMEGEVERLYGLLTQALGVLPLPQQEQVKSELVRLIRSGPRPALTAG